MNNLSARALAIIEILKKLSHPVSSLALSEEIGCSTKTIQSEIKDINKQLKDTKIVSIRGVGYKLEGKIEVDKCINNNIGNIDRIEFIIKTMLNLNLKKESSIKIEELADSMFISVSSVKNDLKEVKEILNKYNVNIVSKHKYGLGVEATEDEIVRCIVDLCSRRDNELSLNDFLSEDINKNTFELKNEILKSLNNIDLILSDIEFKNLCSTIFVKLSRSNYSSYEKFIEEYIKSYKIKREAIMNDDINKEKIYTSKYQLLNTLSADSYPFADRLIEYLLDSAIVPTDEIWKNIARVQDKLSKTTIDKDGESFTYTIKTLGKWDESLRDCIYWLAKTKSRQTKYDMIGYVDSDIERILGDYDYSTNIKR